MKMLICSIGSKKRKDTLRFGVEVAKALSTDTAFLGVANRKRGVAHLEQALAKAARELADQEFPVQVRVEAGDAEDIITAAMEKTSYDLVAVGALGGKRSRRRLLDTVGMRIVEQAKSSILLIKRARSNLSRMLICFSGTKHGRLSVRIGASLASGTGAQVTLLHVVDAMPAMYAGLEQMEETLAELLQSDTDTARELKRAVQVLNAECDCAELKLRRGIVPHEILREGKVGDYDLIVLGSSQYAGGFVRVLMGDLNRAVVSRAERPVLVVRPVNKGTDS